jgi:hypothetical protein
MSEFMLIHNTYSGYYKKHKIPKEYKQLIREWYDIKDLTQDRVDKIVESLRKEEQSHKNVEKNDYTRNYYLD